MKQKKPKKQKTGIGKYIAISVVCFLIGAVWLVLGIMGSLPAFENIFGEGGVVRGTEIGYGIGIVMIIIGAAVLDRGRKKKKKAEEAQAVPEVQETPAVQEAPEAVPLAELPDGTVRETHGLDMRTILSHAADVSTIELQDGTHVASFDFLWGNVYGGEYYYVVSLGRGAAFQMYILHIDNSAPDTAQYVEEGEMREQVIADCTAALQAAGVTLPPPEEAPKKVGILERIKSNIPQRPKAEKGKRLWAFASVAALYIVLLSMGLFCYFRPMGSGDTAELVQGIALAYLLITPSVLLFLSVFDPFGMPYGAKRALNILGIILMIGADVLGLVLFMNMPEPQDHIIGMVITWFLPAALVVSTVAYIFAYLFWCEGLPDGWQIGTAYIVTVLFPVATALILAAIILLFLIMFIRWIISAFGIMLGGSGLERGWKQGWSGESTPSEYEITVDGYTRHLSRLDGNRYRDNVGDVWVTDDGGQTFHKE